MPNYNVNSKIINLRSVHTKRLIAVGEFTQKTWLWELHDLQSHCCSTQVFPFSTYFTGSTLDT